jgi:iron complex transport system substrate-binding protein
MRSFERRTSTRTVIGIVAGLALVTAGCGSESDESSSTITDTTAESVDVTTAETGPVDTAPGDTDPTGTASVDTMAEDAIPDDVPQRVVSLSPTHTEIMFAIGAGDQLVAVDDFSNHPAEALELPHDLSGYEPNVEAIAAYEPDLVLIGGDFNGLGPQLDEIGVPWWDGPAALTLDDTYAQIEQLGAATGHVAEAAELVLQMQTDIEQIIADTPVPDVPLTLYHELDSSFFSADSTTFIGELYGLLGLRNIADEAEGNSGGYPQLNAEFIVSANPDLIFLADTICCGETLATVSARPGWDAITAIRNGDVIEMSDDIASRWGPRVVDYLGAVSAAVTAAAVPA